MDFLHDFESCTSFVPTETEYPFDDEITEGVRLHGIIDRVDMYPNLLRIVDYKSSTHTLSPSKILAGLQLQLLSYALVAEKTFKVQPAGAYYFSLKEEGYDVIAAKRNRKVIEDTDWSEEAEKERMLKARMLKGWTFLDRFTELDDGEKHISLKKNLRDFDAVKECVVMLYDYFRDHLLSGEIPLDPVDGACTFCDNRPVCRFHGTYRPVRPVVDSDLGKGGKE
jgi:ATP-dependent helicase/DNAse subunit B